MRTIPALFALSFALAAPAAAQPVTIEDVRGMAFDKGIVKIEKVELDDGIWESKATTQAGTRSR